MRELIEILQAIGGIPFHHLMMLVTLAVIGLAAFALYVVHAVVKNTGRK